MAKRKKAAKKNAKRKVAKKKATPRDKTRTRHIEANGRTIEVPPDLYERATKKVGLDDSQIAAFPNATALKKFCDKTHLASNPDARPEVGATPPPKAVLDPPDKIEFDSKLEAQFVTMNRASFDNNTLQAEMRKVNRKYGVQKPVRITTDQAMKAVDGKSDRDISVKYLITHYVVYYKE